MIGAKIHRLGVKVRTIDYWAKVRGHAPEKREGIGIVRDHFRPHGIHAKDRSAPYYVVFDDGESGWYDEGEVERVNKKTGR